LQAIKVQSSFSDKLTKLPGLGLGILSLPEENHFLPLPTKEEPADLILRRQSLMFDFFAVLFLTCSENRRF